MFVKLTRIVSFIDKKDEICADELHRFLSEPEWDQLYTGSTMKEIRHRMDL